MVAKLHKIAVISARKAKFSVLSFDYGIVLVLYGAWNDG